MCYDNSIWATYEEAYAMRKSLYLCLGFISLLAAGTALAQLPANPWDTAEFDAAVASPAQPVAQAQATTSTVQETAGADVAHIRRSDERVNIPSIKYKAVNADASAPVFVPAIDSKGNAKTGVMVKSIKTLSDTSSASTPAVTAAQNSAPTKGSWRGSGQFGKLNYTGEATTYGTTYTQEMLAPEVNNHNMKVMLQHLRDLGYKIPAGYDDKFQNFTANYAKDLRRAYDGLGHQNNPFDTMFSGFLDVVEDQSGLDMENLLFNSIDLISKD